MLLRPDIKSSSIGILRAIKSNPNAVSRNSVLITITSEA
ncbi:hypothetical protein CES85_0372 [Ochrobactrum quorumnocens]|uniref:Uncharacterized protein n=1 Tax=Ochrobactrum quorumnocens TaxID=271865 RepID=A0A248UIM0_9HYPH|nr:hypothetical protein CES85_0372 [[Ochrobactrum] quorumnocens]